MPKRLLEFLYCRTLIVYSIQIRYIYSDLVDSMRHMQTLWQRIGEIKLDCGIFIPWLALCLHTHIHNANHTLKMPQPNLISPNRCGSISICLINQPQYPKKWHSIHHYGIQHNEMALDSEFSLCRVSLFWVSRRLTEVSK